MKINGQQLSLRGSNKKYHALDDLDELFAKLKDKSMAQLSKELGVPANSIRHRVVTYFPQEWIDEIQRERKFHKNRTY